MSKISRALATIVALTLLATGLGTGAANAADPTTAQVYLCNPNNGTASGIWYRGYNQNNQRVDTSNNKFDLGAYKCRGLSNWWWRFDKNLEVHFNGIYVIRHVNYDRNNPSWSTVNL